MSSRPKSQRPPLAVVILAAGHGTRMKSRRAKVLHEIAGRPMLAYPVALAESLAPERLVVVIGRDAETPSGRPSRSARTSPSRPSRAAPATPSRRRCPRSRASRARC